MNEQQAKSYTTDDLYSSRYLLEVEDCKETAKKEQPEYKTLVSENEQEKFVEIKNSTQQDDCRPQRQPIENTGLARIRVRSLSLGEIHDEDELCIENLSENGSNSSWDEDNLSRMVGVA